MKKKGDSLKVYDDVERHLTLSSREPEELIKMLFDKACLLLRSTLKHLAERDEEQFQKTSLHALQIVLSLRFVLKTDDRDELSKSLFETYTTIAASLLKAKDSRDKESLEKIYQAMDEIRLAWATLLSKEY